MPIAAICLQIYDRQASMTQGGSKTTGMTQKIRIKDIAERSGVSVGTVDRVLHNRPNVSRPAREKVEKALKELNYQPNM